MAGYTKSGAGVARAAAGGLAIALAAAACAGDAPATRRSTYVAAPDGVGLAVDAYTPHARSGAAGERVPAVLRITRRWRDLERVPRPGIGAPRDFEVRTVTGFGYALVLADARGTGASEGARSSPPSASELGDVRALLDWIAAQAWSDGRVAAWGEGDDAVYAELAAISGHPAVRAAVVRFGDGDLYAQLAHPGGIANRRLLEALGREARLLDAGDACAFVADDTRCDEVDVLFGGPRPVDGHRDALAAVLAGHGDGRARWLGAAASAGARDAVLPAPSDLPAAAHGAPPPPASWPTTIDDGSPLSWLDDLAASDVPIQAWAGWLDGGTVDAALARFLARPRDHEVVVLPTAYRGLEAADPLGALRGEPELDAPAQMAHALAFLERHLGADAATDSLEPGLSLHVAGGGRLDAVAWPPPGAVAIRWRLRSDGRMDAAAATSALAIDPGADGPPSAAQGGDAVVRRLARDPGGGAAGRWLGRLGDGLDYAGPPAGDEAAAAFETAPLRAAATIVGHPVVTVTVSFDRPDGWLHAYLERVDAGGRARLLSDGGLAMVHRAPAPPMPYEPFPARHAFTERARLDAPAGIPFHVAIRLWPIAARLESGDRLRLSLVGGTTAIAPSGAEAGGGEATLVLGAGGEGGWFAVPVLDATAEPSAPR